jgi:hypothetical protein
MSEFRDFRSKFVSLFPTLKDQLPLPPVTLSAIFATEASLQQRQQQLEAFLRGVSAVACLRGSLAEFLGVSERALFPSNAAPSPGAATLVTAALSGGVSAVEQKRGNTDEASQRAHRDREDFIAKHGSAIAALLPAAGAQGSRAAASLATAAPAPAAAAAAAAAAPPPVAPSRARGLEMRPAEALFRFTLRPTADSPYLALSAPGERVWVYTASDTGDGWCFSRNARGEEGYVPRAYVRIT